MMMMGLTNYVRGLIDAMRIRIKSSMGIYEADSCLENTLNEVNRINLLTDASIVITPNGVNEGILHTLKGNSIIPSFNNLGQYTEVSTGWVASQLLLGNSTTTNPFGVSGNVVSIQETAVVNSHFTTNTPSITIISGRTYTFSVYMKKGAGVTAPDIMQLTAIAGFAANYANFNINTGVVTATSGCTAAIDNTGISAGWWRCSITLTATSSVASTWRVYFCNNNPTATLAQNYLGVTTSNAIFTAYQIEEASTPTTYQPIIFTQNLQKGYLEHTRTTTGYKVDSDGSVNEAPQANLIPFSTELNLWSNVNCTVTVNAITAPDGTMTADGSTRTGVSRRHQIGASGYYSLSPVDDYVFSCYAKLDSGTSTTFYLGRDSAISSFGLFDLSTGTITSTAGCTATMTDEGNGWYRCAIYYTAIALGTVMMFTNGTVGTLQCYFWGMQVTRGTVLQPFYTSFTRINTPRVDYTDGTCPTLLTEGTVTNLVLQSEDFSNVSWIKSGITATANTIIAPNQILSADTLSATSSNGYILQPAQANTTAIQRLFSVYMKRKTGVGQISLEMANSTSICSINSSTWTRNWVTDSILTGGTCTNTAGTYVVTTPIAHGLVVGDGIRWIRVANLSGSQFATAGDVVITAVSGNTYTFITGGATGTCTCSHYPTSGRIKLATSGDEIYVWGGQTEIYPTLVNNNYYEPTSYIPTTTATATRASESTTLYKLIENNLLNNTYSLFWDVKKLGGSNSQSYHIALTDTPGTFTSNAIYVSGVPLIVSKIDNGVPSSILASTVYQPSGTTYYKGLITNNNGVIEVWLDGSKVATNSFTNYNRLICLSLAGSVGIARFKNIYGWNRVLTRAEIDLLFEYSYHNAGYTPVNNELQQVINRAHYEGFTIPSTAKLGYMDTLITEMKSDGMWVLTDFFTNFADNDVTLTNWRRINWRNPYGSLQGTITLNGAISTQVDGFKGDGVSAYIDTNFNPAIATYNYILNSAGRLMVVSQSSSGGFNVLDGLNGNSNNSIQSNGTTAWKINAGNFGVNVPATATGLKAIMRYSSSSILGVDNNTLYSGSTASTAINGNNQFILRGSTSYGNSCVACYWMGSSLTNSQIANFRTYYNTFLTNNGLTAFA